MSAAERSRRGGLLRVALDQIARDLPDAPKAIAHRLSEEGRALRALNVEDLRRGASRALPGPAFDFIEGGGADEVTVARNRAAFGALELRPRVLRGVAAVSTATTVLGEPIALPLMGAPHGAGLLFHPDAETGLVRALQGAGTIPVVSVMASQTIEEIARAAPGPKWFQMYVWRDRGMTGELLRRARDTGGYGALVLTIDTPRLGPRERDARNGFVLPPRVTLRSLRGGVAHPRWSARVLRGPEIGLSNFAANDVASGAVYAFDAGLTWRDIAWFREEWPGPLVLKGILSPDDATKAVEIGVDAISVSNHGGRQLDHAPAAIAALPRVLEATGGAIEVYVDGGIRRGTDIAKALALGARACLTARPFLYGLATAGQAGVARAVELLRAELDMTMTLLGCASVDDLDRSFVGPVDQQQR
ncbi:MAG: alpha-hydroxy-acid oxidizing protein [Actinobacteria bacterium]|uniref:Unannotated protein n=1 Tax=freshwater metagenome TaxID=449393 RepID=A0A6J7SIA8_9ZZZZ|nr:alpha-hydroxy-acid oxidizing protein [Actinomycetota bacterium]MSX39109.1 alpha-hydroxy-acid oxidizing protein [Actinomycetota bacterium]